MSEVGQMLVGMMNPVDAAVLVGSGGVGSVAAKSVGSKYLTNYAFKGMSKLSTDASLKYLPKASQKYANLL